MSNADSVIAALRTGYDGLADLVKKFNDEDLAQQSAATEWDLAQVLSHLGSGAEIMTATVRSAIDGTPAPDGDFNQSVWARWDGSTRREQAVGFLEKNEDLVALFESLDAGQREDLRLTLSYLPEPVDVATIARGRLSEFTLHSWDVRKALDPQAALAPEAVPELLQSSGDLLAWISKPAALNGQSVDLAVTTTEPATELTLHLTDPVSIELAPAAKADGTLTLTGEAWLRLVSGRLDPAQDKAVELTGPVTVDTLLEIFPGY
ncbi:maleylpyruvate isomerase family mycothiol-dependent enzyme [Kribbella sp. NPDC056861]|uniref:maleylpyruvate isomerase family mycothiol-dependent enzyme n=1 Tax=Kribbella sp. NPDC056861 TaxID=3154857 RepID=UPI0034121EF1